MEQLIRMEYELKGEIMKIELNQTYTLRGLKKMEEIEKEFKDRGENLKTKIKKEFEKEGKKKMKEVEKKFQEEANKLREQREQECVGMAESACEDVKFDTRGDDLCLDLDFFGDDGKRRKRKTQHQRPPGPRRYRNRIQNKIISKYTTAFFVIVLFLEVIEGHMRSSLLR